LGLCSVLCSLSADPAVVGDDPVLVISQDPDFLHGLGDRMIEYRGKRYHHLASPGYAVTPDRQGFVFVTSPDPSRSILHYVLLSTGEDIEVPLGESGFGNGLGLPQDDGFAHYIEGMDGQNVLFTAKFGRGAPVRHYSLNLEKRSLVEVPAAH